METIIELKNVSFKRGSRIIFDNVSLNIHQGELVAILGPSGTGKTTLTRLITGQLKPDSGEIWVLGEPIHRLNQKQLMLLRQKMSILFQAGALFTDMTVGENVAFPLKEQTQIPNELIDIIVALKLEKVGLRGAKNLFPHELSGGMARRVALARAIALDPQIMIYDEPFTGQDPISLGILVQLVKDLNEGLNLTTLIVSHDVLEVCQIAHKVLLFSGGKLLANDTPEALLNSNLPEIKQFMHAEPFGPVPFHYPAEDYFQELGIKNK